MRVFRLLVEGIRTIEIILLCIDEPVFVALLLLGENFIADFVEDFFIDEGKLAADFGIQNLLLNFFDPSFSVSLILLIRWHATCSDLLSFAADLIFL